jgi:5'-deoxynucleotidase YfbR-like HD superfamily hydrolase
MKKRADKTLDSIYKFMADNYQGNWSYRWGGVPWMQKNIKAGKNESILAHQWACMGFWLTLRDVCPALNALVNTQEIYERVWSHDMGETFVGDISQFRQINGDGVDKHLLEQQEIERMTKFVSAKTSRKIRSYFKEFEKPIEKITKLEALVSKLIDTLQGNHFALVFAEGLKSSENKDSVKKIVERTSVRSANQLLKILKQRGHIKAYDEVLAVVNHHLNYYRKLGIKIDF